MEVCKPNMDGVESAVKVLEFEYSESHVWLVSSSMCWEIQHVQDSSGRTWPRIIRQCCIIRILYTSAIIGTFAVTQVWILTDIGIDHVKFYGEKYAKRIKVQNHLLSAISDPMALKRLVISLCGLLRTIYLHRTIWVKTRSGEGKCSDALYNREFTQIGLREQQTWVPIRKARLILGTQLGLRRTSNVIKDIFKPMTANSLWRAGVSKIILKLDCTWRRNSVYLADIFSEVCLSCKCRAG